MNKGGQQAEVLVTYVAGGDLEDDEVSDPAQNATSTVRESARARKREKE